MNLLAPQSRTWFTLHRLMNNHYPLKLNDPVYKINSFKLKIHSVAKQHCLEPYDAMHTIALQVIIIILLFLFLFLLLLLL